MKTVYIILIASIITATIIAGYLYLKPETSITTIAIDKTDSSVAQIVGQQIIANKVFTGSIWNGHTVRIICLTAYNINPVITVSVDPEFALFTNPPQRKQEIEYFRRRVQSVVDSIAGIKRSQKESIIYKALVQELNYLKSFPGTKKRFWIFSDLRENNSLFSIYTDKAKHLLQTNIDSVRLIFLHAEKPTDLQGISIDFIHQVQSRQENTEFLKMAGLFQNIFTNAGAEVKISATLEN